MRNLTSSCDTNLTLFFVDGLELQEEERLFMTCSYVQVTKKG